jgi:hypothetical protein
MVTLELPLPAPNATNADLRLIGPAKLTLWLAKLEVVDSKATMARGATVVPMEHAIAAIEMNNLQERATSRKTPARECTPDRW